MKIAIFYTSYRQFRELEWTPEFFRRNRRLSSEIDVIYHCNNAGISKGELQARLAKIPCKSMTLLHHPCNEGGYAYGQFEAICDAWETLHSGGWDWVIHLHPDIFITDGDRLLKTIEEAGEEVSLITAPVFGLTEPAYGTTFFAFRPGRMPKEVFGCYVDFVGEPIVVPLENLFFTEVHRQKVAVKSVMQYRGGVHFYDPDHVGLWHEHNLERVPLYLREPGLRWKVTRRKVLGHPLAALTTLRSWLRRRRQGIAQDSLAQYLTFVGSEKRENA
ncbi:MAG: hypothetical protein ABSF29_10085 [Tepidisphaeraceae bacterium]|jgi:hypothetical protein